MKVEFKKWLDLAMQGDAQAQNNVGDCYFNGLDVEKDLVKAAEWHVKARQNGVKPYIFEKDGEAYEPTKEELIELYKQIASWRIKNHYSYYHEYYAGMGDDYSSSGDAYMTLINSIEYNAVKKVIVVNNEFAGVDVTAKCYLGSLNITFYTNGKRVGINVKDESCPRMDGPEDWGYRDEFTLVKV